MKIALVGGNLIDGTGAFASAGRTVIIEGKKIVDICQQKVFGPEVKAIDCTGKTVMPGLMDLHVHLVCGDKDMISWYWGVLPPCLEDSIALIGLKSFSRARKTLEMGFTTLRDVGDVAYVTVALRDAINSGLVEGPRIVSSGCYLNATSGHGNSMPPWLVRTDIMPMVADGLDGVLKAVRTNIHMKTDWIKFCATGGVTVNTWDKQQFNDQELKVLIDEAHAKGRPVCAHCVQSEGTLAAVRAGVDSVEHGVELTEEIIALMLQKGTWLIPTLSAPMTVVKNGEAFGFSMHAIENCRGKIERHIKSFRMALDAGVNIAMGTDAGYGPARHGNNAYELELMVENGMSPMQAIMAATKSAASALGLGDKLGSIEQGKLADIIVVNGNPLENIRILQHKENIAIVMKDGALYIDRITI